MATINNNELFKTAKIVANLNKQNSKTINQLAFNMPNFYNQALHSQMTKMMSPIIELSKLQHDALKPLFEAQRILQAQTNKHIMNSMSFLSKNSILVDAIKEIPKIDPSIFKFLQNDSLKSVFEKINNLPPNIEIEKDEELFQLHVENSLEESDKKLLSDFLDVAVENIPGLKSIRDSLEAKNYTKFVMAILFLLIIYRSDILAFLYENTNYRINRDNVSVRTLPSSNNENVIATLKHNIYVEKIDSNDNGWIKIRFEMEDEKIEEGWIYKTMLSKIE